MNKASVDMVLDAIGGYDHLTALIVFQKTNVYPFEIHVTRHYMENGRRKIKDYDLYWAKTLQEARGYLCNIAVAEVRDQKGSLRDVATWKRIRR